MNIKNLSNDELIKLVKKVKTEIRKRKITQKVVVNCCYGGFGLSDLALERVKELGLNLDNDRSGYEVDRNDPRLIQTIEELGDKASAGLSAIKVVEVPDYGEGYFIEDYDGVETPYPR